MSKKYTDVVEMMQDILGDLDPEFIEELREQIEHRREIVDDAAVAAERARCAGIARSWDTGLTNVAQLIAKEIEDGINTGGQDAQETDKASAADG